MGCAFAINRCTAADRSVGSKEAVALQLDAHSTAPLIDINRPSVSPCGNENENHFLNIFFVSS